MLVIHIFAQMYPLLQTVTKLYSAKEWQIANTLIPSIRFVFIILGSFGCCSASWNVLITPSIKPLWSSHGSGCKREIAFISPFIPP